MFNVEDNGNNLSIVTLPMAISQWRLLPNFIDPWETPEDVQRW